MPPNRTDTRRALRRLVSERSTQRGPGLALAAAMLAAACTSPGAPRDHPAEARASSAAARVYTYRCESGETISAAYPDTDSATVHYKQQRYAMRIAVSASGARYVGGGLEWWTKGSGPGAPGTLLRHLADGSSGDIVESCAQS